MYYVFSETDTEPDIGTDCTGSDGAQANCARPWGTKEVTVSGNNSEITITATELADKDPVSGPEGNHFDFKIRCTPLVKGCDENKNGHTTEALCIAGATDHDDNAANHWRAGYPDQVYIDVDTWGDAGNNPYLSYDIVDPYFGPAGPPTAPTGSFFVEGGYFSFNNRFCELSITINMDFCNDWWKGIFSFSSNDRHDGFDHFGIGCFFYIIAIRSFCCV